MPGKKSTLSNPFQNPPESNAQKALADLLDTIRLHDRPLLWCHPANEGHRDLLYAVELKRRGVKAGVPDVLIFDPPPRVPGAVGTALELKRKKGGQVTEEQNGWLTGLADRGWVALVVHGIAEAEDALRRLGYLRRN